MMFRLSNKTRSIRTDQVPVGQAGGQPDKQAPLGPRVDHVDSDPGGGG